MDQLQQKNSFENQERNLGKTSEDFTFYSPLSNDFIFDLNKWMYNGKDQTWTQILGTKRLVPGTIKKLKFRRIKTSYGNLKIGITQR